MRRALARVAALVGVACLATSLVSPAAHAANGTFEWGLGGPCNPEQHFCFWFFDVTTLTDPPAGCYEIPENKSDKLYRYMRNRLDTSVRIHRGANCQGAASDSIAAGANRIGPDAKFYVYIPK
ncbi:hypothetical protein ACWEFJ_18890 [Actinosynnema sp. NPDC004786]